MPHAKRLLRQTAGKLTGSISDRPFDRQKTARQGFIISIACAVTAVAALLADRMLPQLLMRIFHSPAVAKCGFFAAVSAAIFRYGLLRRKKHPQRGDSNEAVFFLGVLAPAAGVSFLGVAIDTGTARSSVPSRFAAFSYALSGSWFPSTQVWVFGLLSLGVWIRLKPESSAFCTSSWLCGSCPSSETRATRRNGKERNGAALA